MVPKELWISYVMMSWLVFFICNGKWFKQLLVNLKITEFSLSIIFHQRLMNIKTHFMDFHTPLEIVHLKNDSFTSGFFRNIMSLWYFFPYYTVVTLINIIFFNTEKAYQIMQNKHFASYFNVISINMLI